MEQTYQNGKNARLINKRFSEGSGSAEVLKALLAPELEDWAGFQWSESDLQAILLHQLEVSLEPSGPAAHITVREILYRSSPVAQEMVCLKDFAKKALQDGGLPREVAKVLYALCLHRSAHARLQGVTSLSREAIEREVRWCLTLGWLPEEVRKLIRN